MKIEEFEKELNKVYCGYIKKFQVDLCNFEIILDISVTSLGNTEMHHVVFNKVSAFFYDNDSGGESFQTKKWESAEISEVYFSKKPSDHIWHKNDKQGTKQYYSDFNFYLEIWSHLLLINAGGVTIDDCSYDIASLDE